MLAASADGILAVDIDGRPYAPDRRLGRADLRSTIDGITSDLGTAVRVEVRESDGTTYADIVTPPEPAPAADKPSPAALAGFGFRPGEDVALAYVVVRQPADSDGNASINLPPALLSSTRGGLVLLGLTSHTVVPVEAPA